VRHWQYINKIVRQNYTSQLRNERIKERKQPLFYNVNCQPQKCGIILQKHNLIERCANLLAVATYKPKPVTSTIFSRVNRFSRNTQPYSHASVISPE
jgi:ABC-type phosphate/phosphonate transport system ATPase subunit